MPFCDVGHYKRKFNLQSCSKVVAEDDTDTVKIYYRTYGQGDIKVLLIMGLAATHEAWNPQILRLAGTDVPNEEDDTADHVSTFHNRSQSLDDFASLQQTQSKDFSFDEGTVAPTGIQVCAFDNRGVGKSSAPQSKSEYATAIMAMDAVAVMDHLGWDKAHVFGHSLGAMTACKMAATVPDRIASLALLSATGGGYQCLPKLGSTLVSLTYRFWKAKSPEERALVDLDTHYTKEYLDSIVGEFSRREILYKEYIRNTIASGMQPQHGLHGQLHACWTHGVTSEEYKRIRSSGFLVSVIHGRGDIIAQIAHARAIVEHLHPVACMVELSGGHLITHQNTDEVNQELAKLIQAAQSRVHHSEWTNAQCEVLGMQEIRVSSEKQEEEKEAESKTGRFAFLNTCYRWLKGGSYFSPLKKLCRCFLKDKE